MKLDYSFMVPVGKEYYSSDRDETFQAEESIDWEFEVDDEQQCRALVDIYSDSSKPIEVQATEIINALLTKSQIKDIIDDMDARTLNGALSEAMLELMSRKELNIYNLLVRLLGEIEYWTDTLTEKFGDYFEDEAREDFDQNYND